MNRFWAAFVIVLIQSVPTTSAEARAALPTTVVLVADEWAPYNMVPNTHPEGYLVDLAREIFARKKIRVDYRVVPWARAVQDTRAGVYDGVIGASVADAEGFVFPSEPLAVNYLGFVTTTKTQWRYLGHQSVESVRLGVIKGYDYRPWLSAYVQQHQGSSDRVQVMVGDNPLAINLRKLLDGKLDVVVDSQTALLYTAQSLGVGDQLRDAGHDTEAALIHVAFSPAKPASAELATILSQGIVDLRRSGRLAEILRTYGLKDWKN